MREAQERLALQIRNLCSVMKACKLTATCPYCGGKGCTQCNGIGLVTDTIRKLSPEVLD